MCPAAIPIDHDRRWRDDFQEEKKKKKNTHYPQIGTSTNKEETLFSHNAYSCQDARVIEIICY